MTAGPSLFAPVIIVAACALVDSDGRVLVARRPAGKPMAGLWEFPGGKLQEAETPERCLIRELGEELGIATDESCLAPLTFASHRYDGFHLLMPLYVCRKWRNEVRSRENQALRWLHPVHLFALPMPEADRPLIPFLVEWL
ncbi:MAG: (deoxy)nucleoside triphosphate pyrophosphohydrolase [Geminicoccaceae bacterium]|nr:(deoxy)nucleoside triphosphate pyrophosphohydrolase [Geminicoccaceae bacterium]